MAIHTLGGMKACYSRNLIFPTFVSKGQSVYGDKQVSPSSIRQSQPENETCPRVPGLGYYARQGSLKQHSIRVNCRLRRLEPRNATLFRVPLICYASEQGSLKELSGGDEDTPVFYYEGPGVSKQQYATAHEEVEAEETRTPLSPNTSCRDKRIFIFGFGYTSCTLAGYLKEKNWKVSGTCRSDESKAALEQCGYSIHLFNSDNDGEEMRDDGLRELQQASHWLTSVPPVADFSRDPVLATHIQDLKQAVEKGNVGWIGYLSSTGVYGDWHGDWVDEESDPRPVEPRAVARLAAEESWLKFGLDYGVPVHIFRLGGIYGPGRSALNTILRKGALSGRQQNREMRRFTSRIHVADICQTVFASMQNPCSGRTYNVVDDDPASRMEVLAYAQGLLNNQNQNPLNPSTEGSIPSQNMAVNRSSIASRMGEKRVSNKRIKEELQVQLQYPTYKSGLSAILEAVKSQTLA